MMYAVGVNYIHFGNLSIKWQGVTALFACRTKIQG